MTASSKKRATSTSRDIPWNKRVCMDELFVYNNEAPSYGLSVTEEPINRVRDKRGKCLTLYLAIRVDGLVHMPILKPENADDFEFMKYVWSRPEFHISLGKLRKNMFRERNDFPLFLFFFDTKKRE